MLETMIVACGSCNKLVGVGPTGLSYCPSPGCKMQFEAVDKEHFRARSDAHAEWTRAIQAESK